MRGLLLAAAWLAIAGGCAGAARAAEAVEHDWVARDFRFHTGEVAPELRIHYRTLGERTGQPVLVLHGTAQSGAALLNPGFAGPLFGPGRALDPARYYVIIPDAIGVGGSSKPSDGLRSKFPAYDYADMVQAQHRLLTEGMGLQHVRLIIGNSMGGMMTWEWAEAYPGFADGYVPMASQPTAMASRNWMMRRMLVQTIRSDAAYAGGAYTTQPPIVRMAATLFGIGTSGGTLAWQAQAPTTAAADKLVDGILSGPAPIDANDFVYQWDASRDYDAEPGLERIKGRVLVINSADDERNPPETGVTERALARIPGAEYFLIPASAETRGHGTTGLSRFWAERLGEFLSRLPVQQAAR